MSYPGVRVDVDGEQNRCGEDPSAEGDGEHGSEGAAAADQDHHRGPQSVDRRPRPGRLCSQKTRQTLRKAGTCSECITNKALLQNRCL